jgi:hypothetical protein
MSTADLGIAKILEFANKYILFLGLILAVLQIVKFLI